MLVWVVKTGGGQLIDVQAARAEPVRMPHARGCLIVMIHVDRLSKRFGSFKAVDGIRFEVGRGEIVGLLGPNGAGKTTTMRMLTTYLSPTSGRATLAGHDVLDEPLEVRRKVGYLPENVPLYPEMRVNEYLQLSVQAQRRAALAAPPGDRRGRAPLPARRGRSGGSSASFRGGSGSGSAWPRRWCTTRRS